MSHPQSIAVGRIAAEHDPRALLWGMFDGLDHEGFRVQIFQGSAQHLDCQAATAITGLCPRHLDSWLMTPPQQVHFFARGSVDCDLAILWGNCDSTHATDSPSRLEPLSEQLSIPLLALVDVRTLQPCQQLVLPRHCAGLLLDYVPDSRTLAYWKTEFESLYRLPVLGAMSTCAELRAKITQGDCSQTGRELYRTLGHEFTRLTSTKELLAAFRPTGHATTLSSNLGQSMSGNIRHDGAHVQGLRIAVAYDEVFRCYFPDVLQAFELAGATVMDFSPLHDEALPADVDLVYLGDGRVWSAAEALVGNRCLTAALRDHVCSGKRIYAEAGGMAYLAQQIRSPSGEAVEMLGILPTIAHWQPQQAHSTATTITTLGHSWLTQANESWRTYRNNAWRIEPLERATVLACDEQGNADLIQRHQAIGGRLQLHLGVQRELLKRCLAPCPASLAWSLSRG